MVLDLAKAPHASELKAALKAVDRVHDLGNVRLPVIPVTRDATGDLGGLVVERGRPARITVARGGPHPGLTLLHEVGHLLEMFAVSGHRDGRRDWRTDATLSEWAQAVDRSEAIRNISRIFNEGVSVRDDQRLAKAGYYLRHNEIWARTYAQYIAVRSRDSRLME